MLSIIFSFSLYSSEFQGYREINQIISNDLVLKKKKPPYLFTLIVDDFATNKEISEKILETLPKEVILSIPACLPTNLELIKSAIDKGFKIAISIDHISSEQWKNLQNAIVKFNGEIISKNAKLDGLLIWNVSEKEELSSVISEISNWCKLNNMWVLFLNSNNIDERTVPESIYTADGFVTRDDLSEYLENMANFCLEQSKYKKNSIMVVKQAKQHLDVLNNWFKKNIEITKLNILSNKK